MNKEEILDNIEKLFPEKIASFIKQKIVTTQELMECGMTYEASKRREVKNILIDSERIDWDNTESAQTAEAYQNYIDTYQDIYPEENYFQEHLAKARQAIANLQTSNEEKDWENAKSQKTAEAYNAYLNSYKRGKHRDEARKALEDINAWNQVDQTNPEDLSQFIKANPNSSFVEQAKKIMAEIEEEVRKKVKKKNSDYVKYDMEALLKAIDAIQTQDFVLNKSQKTYELIETALRNKDIDIDDLLDVIEDDKNVFSAFVIKNLVTKGFLEYEDLEDISIGKNFIRKLTGEIKGKQFNQANRSLNISRISTEVFFWGIPSSGKTCALGLILSVIQNGLVGESVVLDTKCQGYDYMNLLPQCFSLDDENGVVILPEGTPVTSSYEMGFDIEDSKHKIHPITFIDFAGEMIKCMYKRHAGIPLGIDAERALRDLTNVLGGRDQEGNEIGNRTKNRKIHFFVIEYGAENRIYDGLPQKNYLDSVATYINNTGILRSNTDAIYVLVTKVDKIKVKDENERNRILAQYINTKYRTFYGTLQRICREYRINGGNVPVLPFSLGAVCFQLLCKLNTNYAESIAQIILDRSHGYDAGYKGLIGQTFRG